MGLDMYLEADRYINTCDHSTEDIKLGSELAKVAGVPDGFRVGGLNVRLAYWRKANAIHAWFVANVQDGEDDCKPYDVSSEQLIHLRDAAQYVLDNPKSAKAKLPPKAGFFFGSAKVDEDYMEDMRYTVKQITAILAAFPETDYNWTFSYRASW